MKMLDNNEINLILIRDSGNQNWKKHVNVFHHHVCRLLEDEKLDINWIENSAILVVKLIKALSIALLKKISKKIKADRIRKMF